MPKGHLEHANISVTDPERSAALLIDLLGWHERWKGDAMSGGRTIHVGTDDAYSTHNLELFVADFRKRTARSLTDHTDYCLQAFILGDCGEAGFDNQIEWSADGKRILARIGWHGEGRHHGRPHRAARSW